VAVWTLRHIDTGGKRRTFASLLHGTMAGGMPSALGLQKCQPGRQVVCLAGVDARRLEEALRAAGPSLLFAALVKIPEGALQELDYGIDR
jgi:hypothetical protein